MKSCNIESLDGTIIVRPNFHDRLERWIGDGIGEEQNVVIPANSSFAEVGAALRLAFSHCVKWERDC